MLHLRLSSASVSILAASDLPVLILISVSNVRQMSPSCGDFGHSVGVVEGGFWGSMYSDGMKIAVINTRLKMTNAATSLRTDAGLPVPEWSRRV